MRLYFDNDSGEQALVRALRRLGHDCLTSAEAGRMRAPDNEQLAFATAEARIMITANQGDYMRLHYELLAQGKSHSGILIVEQHLDLRLRLRRMAQVARRFSPEEWPGHLEFLNGAFDVE